MINLQPGCSFKSTSKLVDDLTYNQQIKCLIYLIRLNTLTTNDSVNRYWIEKKGNNQNCGEATSEKRATRARWLGLRACVRQDLQLLHKSQMGIGFFLRWLQTIDQSTRTEKTSLHPHQFQDSVVSRPAGQTFPPDQIKHMCTSALIAKHSIPPICVWRVRLGKGNRVDETNYARASP